MSVVLTLAGADAGRMVGRWYQDVNGLPVMTVWGGNDGIHRVRFHFTSIGRYCVPSEAVAENGRFNLTLDCGPHGLYAIVYGIQRIELNGSEAILVPTEHGFWMLKNPSTVWLVKASLQRRVDASAETFDDWLADISG